MNKFLLITKINLLRFFDFKRINNSKYQSTKKKNIIKIFLALIIIFYFTYSIYDFTSYIMPAFISLNMPIYIFGLFFSITSVFILFNNLFKVKTMLFDYNDYDLLNAMPIKRSTIILSKMVSVYLLNLLYTFVIMIPVYLAYIKYNSSSFGILYFLLLFIIPIVPLIVSYLIGIFLSWLMSHFKNKNIGSFIVNLTFVILVMVISFKMNNLDIDNIANGSINIVNRIEGIYPLTKLFIWLLNHFEIIKLLEFILIPIILTTVFIMIINCFYIRIRTKLLKVNVSDNYEVKMYHRRSSLMSLYKKEMKKFCSSSMYILNTIFGCILLIVLVFCLLIFNNNTIANFLNIPDFTNTLKMNVILVISIACVLSSTTYPSISLEGKNLWIMKMLPVSSDKILLSKIFVNLTFTIPTIIITGTIFGIYFHFNFVEFLIIYLMPLMYAIFTAILGLIYNLLFPKFDYENEVKVIKQSMPAFLTIFSGIIMVFLPLTLLRGNSMLLLVLLMFIINIMLSIILHYYGNIKMKRL